MNNTTKKIRPQGKPGAAADSERRRIATVVHDDRGNASVEWQDAPADYQRPVLEIVGDLSLQKDEKSYDPYARRALREEPRAGSTTRTDLRKLSEWIKMVRELEERKRLGCDEGDGDPTI